MSGGAPTAASLPPADPGALRACAGLLGATASTLSRDGAQVASVTSGAAGSWSGPAASVWERMGREQVAYFRAGAVLDEARDALNRLASQIEAAQAAAGRANLAALGAFMRRELTVVASAAVGQPAPPDHEYQAELGRARAAGRAAEAEFEQATRAAVATLRAVAAAAPTIAVLGGPAAPVHRDGGGLSASFLTLLLGSVTTNRTDGLTFQDEVLQELGLDENFSLVPPWLLVGRTRPDALTETEMVETKNVAYQASTYQLRTQLRYARATGLRFTLVVNRSTRISEPLRTSIQHIPGARILRYQGNGIFSDNAKPKDPDPTLYRRVDGRFERVSLEPKAAEPLPGETVPATPGEDPVAPEEPVVPEEAVVPEPEVPEVPEIPEVPLTP